MKKIIKLLALSLFLVFALEGTVFASELPSLKKGSDQDTKIESKAFKETRHFSHSASRILENKYGIKAEDIEKAKTSGKTFFDLAKEKGLNEADLKAAIIAPRLKALEEAVNTGELSNEKAEEIKTKTKENIQEWDGKIENFKEHKEKDKDHNKCKDNKCKTPNEQAS
jgi:hypothetical protein